MEDKPVITSLDDNFIFSGGGNSDDYKPAPVGEPLEAHVYDIEQTEQIDNFKTRPDGTPNPNYGKPVKKLIFKFKLDKTEVAGAAGGQVYTCWVGASVSDKSNLGRISTAIYGSALGLLEHKKGAVIGMPLRITLKPQKTNPERSVVDVEKLFPPTAKQTKTVVTRDTLPTNNEVTQADDLLDEAMSVFDGATAVK